MKKEEIIRKFNTLKLLILKNKKISISILSGILCVVVVATVIAVKFNAPIAPIKTAKVQTSSIADILKNDTSTNQSQSEIESTSSHNDNKLNASDSDDTQKETVSENPSDISTSEQYNTDKDNRTVSSSKTEDNHTAEEQQIKPSSPSISTPSSSSVPEATPPQVEPEPSQPESSFDEAAVINGVIRQVSSFMTHIDISEFGGSNYYIDHYSTDLTEDQIIAKLVSGYQFEHSTGSTYFAIEYLGISTEYSRQPHHVFRYYRA